MFVREIVDILIEIQCGPHDRIITSKWNYRI